MCENCTSLLVLGYVLVASLSRPATSLKVEGKSETLQTTQNLLIGSSDRGVTGLTVEVEPDNDEDDEGYFLGEGILADGRELQFPSASLAAEDIFTPQEETRAAEVRTLIESTHRGGRT